MIDYAKYYEDDKFNLDLALRRLVPKLLKVLPGILKQIPRRFFTSRVVFSLCQKLGFYVIPNHFYYPIPDTRNLKNSLWSNHSELIGINMNREKQLELLSIFESNFKPEYEQFSTNKTTVPHEYYLSNAIFKSIDTETLYCIVRYFKPSNIYEIGSGNTTYLSAKALVKNMAQDSQYQCQLIAIDPYPNEILRAGFPSFSKVIIKKMQDIPYTEFSALKENDILFIDSSHVLKIGSDVQYEYLEILPRLRVGVIIHVHDIFMPAEYPRKWVLTDHMFWNEQYLLQAFLSFNESFEVMWAGSYMHLNYPERLERAFKSYNRLKTWPGSVWIRRIR